MQNAIILSYAIRMNTLIQFSRQDERGFYLICEETSFYPQGGGQPADQGIIVVDSLQIPILAVRKVENEIRHYTDKAYPDIQGCKAVLHINEEMRTLHSKLHSAGHLLCHIVETLYPTLKGVKGHHFPGECYVEFTALGDTPAIDLAQINTEILSAIKQNLSIRVTQNGPIRFVQIGEYPPQGCGGTHVSSTSEIDPFESTKIKAGKNTFKISYK